MAVVVGNFTKSRGLARANIRYIQQRPGKDREKLTRTLFGSGGIMGRREAYRMIDDEASKGRLFYRFKLSPDPSREDTRRDLDMQQLTRQMMQSLEKRLTIAIPWVAALHDDHTSIRHEHLLAALPRPLNTQELEFLIREATKACVEQRRGLDVSQERRSWQHHTTYQTVKTGITHSQTTTTYRAPRVSGHMPQGSPSAKVHTSCACPRCHFPQAHNRQTKVHQCVSCGLILHQKRELSLQRKGREWER